MLNSKQKLTKKLKNLCVKLTGTLSKKKTPKLIVDDISNGCGDIDKILSNLKLVYELIYTNYIGEPIESKASSIKEGIGELCGFLVSFSIGKEPYVIEEPSIEEILEKCVKDLKGCTVDIGTVIDLEKFKALIIKYIGTLDILLQSDGQTAGTFTLHFSGKAGNDASIQITQGTDIAYVHTLLGLSEWSENTGPVININNEGQPTTVAQFLAMENVIEGFNSYITKIKMEGIVFTYLQVDDNFYDVPVEEAIEIFIKGGN